MTTLFKINLIILCKTNLRGKEGKEKSLRRPLPYSKWKMSMTKLVGVELKRNIYDVFLS